MSPRKRTSPWRPSSARATEIFILEVSRPTKTALSCCMARPLCVRLGAGPSGATLVRRIARDEPPPLQQRTYGLPDVLNRVQFGSPGGQEDERQVLRHDQMARGVPSGAVEQQDRMRASRHRARDLVQVEVHGWRIGVGHGQARPRAAGRANGSEQVGALIALIGRLARTRAAPGPLPNAPILLADAGLIRKPDLDRLGRWEVG